jgi:excisionase family DNA binding protein
MAVTSSPPPAAQTAATGGALSVQQCCEYINVHRTKFYAEVNSGRLELRKIGSKSVVFRSEAERWLHALPTAMATEKLDRKENPGKPPRSADRQGAGIEKESA